LQKQKYYNKMSTVPTATPAITMSKKKTRTPWYKMLNAPAHHDVRRRRSTTNQDADENQNDDDKPSPLEPRRLHDGDDIRSNEITTPPATTRDEQEDEEEEEEEEGINEEEDDDEDTSVFEDEVDENCGVSSAADNVLLSVQSIRTALEGNLCCPVCNKKVMAVQDPAEGLGFAGNINIYCRYCEKDTLNLGMGDTKYRKTVTPVDGNTQAPPVKKRKKKKAFLDYAINYNAVLMMQQLGFSIQGLESMQAFLGIASSYGNYAKWKLIQDYIGEAEDILCKEVMKENTDEEIRLVKEEAKEQYKMWHTSSDGRGTNQQGKITRMQEYLHWRDNRVGLTIGTDGDNRVGLTIGTDGAWHKRVIGKGTYNSLTGHNFAVGGLSKKILSTVVYSKMCTTCTNAAKAGLQPAAHRCSKNFDDLKSSKAMEGAAAVQHCMNVGAQPTGAYVHTLVTDDDSTVRANTKHSYKAEADRDYPGWTRRANTNWPFFNMDNSKVPPKPVFLMDKGLLPLQCPKVTEWLSDIGHRVKCIGGFVFSLKATSKKALKQGTHLSKGECIKLKKLAGYFLKTPENQELPFDIFCKRAPCMYLHHFNDHSCCSDKWCKVLKSKRQEDPVPLPTNYCKRFRCKQQHSVLFKKMEQGMSTYLTVEALKQVYHKYSTQKNESLNKKVTVVAPKDKYYGGTRTLQDRIHWVVVEDSVGYYHGIRRLFVQLGIPFDPILQSYGKRRDKRAMVWSNHRKKGTVKAKRVAKQNAAIKASNEQDKAAFAAGVSYGSGIALLDDLIEDAEEDGTATDQNCDKLAVVNNAPCQKNN
jgi:hypothetical protein